MTGVREAGVTGADLRLAPGDCLVFDNTRVLHARTAFATTRPTQDTATRARGG